MGIWELIESELVELWTCQMNKLAELQLFEQTNLLNLTWPQSPAGLRFG